MQFLAETAFFWCEIGGFLGVRLFGSEAFWGAFGVVRLRVGA